MLIYLPLVIMGVYLLTLSYKRIVKIGCKSERVNAVLVPVRAFRLKELIWSITLQGRNSDSSEEELIHDRLTAEYSEFDERGVIETS